MGTNFPYPLEGVKWNPTEKKLENKGDLIKQILEYVHQKIATRPPHTYLDAILMNLVFVKQMSLNSQEYKLMKVRILVAEREYFAELLWKSVYAKIMRVKQQGLFGASLMIWITKGN